MSESTPFIGTVHSLSRPTTCKRHRLISFVTYLLIYVIIYLVATQLNGFYTQYADQYSYKRIISSLFNSSMANGSQLMAIPGTQHYITASFRATCANAGLSNQLYEFVSLYGIARTLGRIPYANLMTDCLLNHTKEMLAYFPQMALAIELKVVSKEMTTEVDFGNKYCCIYEDVGKLMVYNTSRFIDLSASFLQSYKFFDQYRVEVLRLLTFTDEDIAATEKIANETFKNDVTHRICVHTRRGDFVNSSMHQFSTESFTMTSVHYVREKLMKKGVNTTVALLGDDRSWVKALFANFSWALVPEQTNRITTDYAFMARHCHTIILTASASTFGFWSTYLSSAENVYFNEKYATSTVLSDIFNPADVFLPSWICLRLNETTNIISEVPR